MSVRYRKIYLDLDRTLYDTDRAAAAIFAALEKKYAHAGITGDVLRQNEKAFYRYVGDWYYYDLFGHLEASGLDAHEVENYLLKALHNNDLLFPDARALLIFLANRPHGVVILSFGDSRYQAFKYSLLAELLKFSFVCLQRSKGEYISAQGSEPSILIDDKKVVDLPETCQGVLLDRTVAEPLDTRNTYWVINNLRIAKELLL